MRRWPSLLIFLAACGTGNNIDGTRGNCAEGGALTDTCDGEVSTPADACWRMVDCGAIPIFNDDNNVFDWGNCTDYIDTLTSTRQTLVIACIAGSSCDMLKGDNWPDVPYRDQFQCIRIGDR
jgi:hypothetical protein